MESMKRPSLHLTQDVVLQKANCSNLSAIKALNLWGCGISDISILSQLPNVEVLSLSMNSISSLSALQNCTHLTELFLRKNALKELEQVVFLQNLSSLRVLWLNDNPISEDPLYRMSIIKNLPQLEKLDNIVITEAERSQAESKGVHLIAPKSNLSESSSKVEMTTSDPITEEVNEKGVENQLNRTRPRRRDRKRLSGSPSIVADENDTNLTKKKLPPKPQSSEAEKIAQTSKAKDDVVDTSKKVYQAISSLLPLLDKQELHQLENNIQELLARK